MEKLCKIRDLQRAVAQFEVQFEKQYGICLNEGMLLCSLSMSEQLSSGELSELLGLTHSNTSKVLKSAEAKGLIERGMGIKDKRQMYFSLSGTGKVLLKEIKCGEIDLPDLLNRLL